MSEDSEKYRPKGFEEALERASGSSQQLDRSRFDALGDQFVADMTEYFDPETDNTRPGSPFADPDETWVFNTLRILVAGGYKFKGSLLSTILRLLDFRIDLVRLRLVCDMIKACWSDDLAGVTRDIQNQYNLASDGTYENHIGALLQMLTGEPPRKVGLPRDWLKEFGLNVVDTAEDESTPTNASSAEVALPDLPSLPPDPHVP